MACVTMRNLTKVFPGGTVAVDHVDLTVGDGEFVVLVGPSGCGKSTLLRMVAGLEDVTTGVVEIDGQVVNNLSPRERDIAMVFQNYALYPHYTVEENLGFSLRIRGLPRQQTREQVMKTARVLGLESFLARKPAALSGGQRQRVAMGRSLVRQPSVLLMDEPLSNLDAKLRVAMRGELIRLHQRYRTTTLYVTHDQVEAMTLGDRIAVLDRGKLQQVGTPAELYRSPRNVFVAGFIGSPAMNLARGYLIDDGGMAMLVAREFRAPLPDDWAHRWPTLVTRIGQEVIFGLRPDAFDVATPDCSVPTLAAKAVTVESLGDEKNVLFVPPLDQDGVEGVPTSEGEPAPLWTARLQPDAAVRASDMLLLWPDLRRAYFFDLTTGEAVPAEPIPVMAEDQVILEDTVTAGGRAAG
jgi:multiple sugar transport system ATP-binding protein